MDTIWLTLIVCAPPGLSKLSLIPCVVEIASLKIYSDDPSSIPPSEPPTTTEPSTTFEPPTTTEPSTTFEPPTTTEQPTTTDTVSSSSPPTSTSSSVTPSCLSTYTSAAGDTCDTLDKTYHLVSGTIKQVNQFLDCGNIWTSTSICIPDGPYNAPTCKSTYVSAAGDTCSSIETKFNLVEGTTKTANSFLTCTGIWAHTQICIPDGPYRQTACKTTYISMAGDTCVTIDNEFNLIDGTTKSANPFLTCSDIWTATPICIPDGPYKTSYEPNCATQTYRSLAGETWCVKWSEYYCDL